MPGRDVSDYIIEIEGLVKRYKLYSGPKQFISDQFGLRKLPFRNWAPIPEFQALHGVDFRLRRGERVGLIGRNGAGKTTLLRLIAGGIYPTSGTIRVNGKIQPLMQSGVGFHPDFTGRQNIEATLQYRGLVGREFETTRDEVIDWVELGEFLEQPFSTYSLGMQARTQFAVTTAVKTDALLIDEMLGAGDGYFTSKSATRMKKLISDGTSLVLVSHDAGAILRFCERVVWLRDGMVHRDGPAEEVVPEYEQEQEMMAGSGAGARAAAVTTIDPFTLPGSLQTEFVRSSIAAAEPGKSPASSPLRIIDVRLSTDQQRKTGLHVGDKVCVEIDLKREPEADIPVRLSILVYSVSGERIARTSGEYRGLARIATAVAKLDPLILGTGHYVVSVMAEDADSGQILDLKSGCGALNFASSNESDPPKIHIPSLWKLGDSPEFEPGRLSGML